MTSRELVVSLRGLRTQFDASTYLLEQLQTMDSYNADVVALNAQALAETDGQRTLNIIQQSRNQLAQKKDKLKKLGHGRIFREAEALVMALTQRSCALDETTQNMMAATAADLTAFLDAYQTFISEQGLGEASRLLAEAQRVRASIQGWRGLAAFVEANLGIEEPAVAEAIEVYLDGQLTFLEFTAKLNAIGVVYEELCRLLEVSTKREPLSIARIESGSLFAALKGNPKAMSIMADLVRNVAAYVYRTHTKEGRLGALPRKVEAVERVLGLKEEMEKQGMNTGRMQGDLEKAGQVISKELFVLLNGGRTIELNREVISLTPNSQSILVQEGKVQLIGCDGDGDSNLQGPGTQSKPLGESDKC